MAGDRRAVRAWPSDGGAGTARLAYDLVGNQPGHLASRARYVSDCAGIAGRRWGVVDRRDRGVLPARLCPARLGGAAVGLGEPAWRQVAGVLLGRPFADRIRERDREPLRSPGHAAGFWPRIASFRMVFLILNGPAHDCCLLANYLPSAL